MNDIPTITTREDEQLSEEFIMVIPQCCREGWDSCPHVVNRPKQPNKKNIGL